MEIKTYRAASMQEALRMVRRELGPDAAVLRTRDVRSGGMLGLLTGQRGVEVDASAEMIVPSRLPKRPTLLDQGIDLTEAVPFRGNRTPSTTTDKTPNLYPLPFHLIVCGATGGAGTTTIAANLAFLLTQRGLHTDLADAELRPSSTNRRLGMNVDSLLANIVIFDLGGNQARSFGHLWDAANLVLLVVTPEPKAILDGYAAIKLLADRRPHLRLQTVVSLARDEFEANQVHRQIAQASRRFLNLEITAAGSVPFDPNVPLAARANRPVVVHAPLSTASQQMERMAASLATAYRTPNRSSIETLRFQSTENLKITESAAQRGR